MANNYFTLDDTNPELGLMRLEKISNSRIIRSEKKDGINLGKRF
jgi:hypothetical protein